MELNKIKEEALAKIASAATPKDINMLRSEYLGKKGPIAEAMATMKELDGAEKAEFGKNVNIIKGELAKAIQAKNEELADAELNAKIANESIDISLPVYGPKVGSIHPLTKIVDDVVELFENMGYSVKDGPEVETDEMNFEKLNIPKDHPARDMQDTFYIDAVNLLRTHTSPVQARTMMDTKEEAVKIIVPGKVYRRDDDDATHSHQFGQIEVLHVSKDVNMGDLKATLLLLARTMFGADREIRMRPSFFPFTEPSTEVDVTCHKCNGKGCNICKGTGWIEILGAGMVHPNVLEACGYDPKVYRGFAAGMGIERLAMLKYGVADIREFYGNDLRFLKQFKGEK